MTFGDMKDRIETIIEVHPEAAKAEVWSHSVETGHSLHVKNISYDKRHKPPRLKLED